MCLQLFITLNLRLFKASSFLFILQISEKKKKKQIVDTLKPNLKLADRTEVDEINK